MQPTSLYGHTIEAYSIFQQNPAIPADGILRRFFAERKYLGAKDRRFISAAYFGTIRNWMRLEAIIRDCFPDPEVTPARTLAAFAIAIRNERPEEVQEVLARYDLPLDALECMANRERETTRLEALTPNERLARSYSFPVWFVERIAEEYGVEQTEKILISLNEGAPTSIRVNTVLTSREELQEELSREGIETSASQVAPDALVLTGRMNVFDSTAFRRGAFEVQDEGSQLIAPFARILKMSSKVLDACAGAGGKSLHFSSLLQNRGEIFATDVEPKKLEALRERTRRSGAQNIRIVLPEQKERMLGQDKTGWFDVILTDVPCTGTGTLRRNPGIKWLLNETMLQELVQKQRHIMEENARFVKPNGVFLYATCSLLHEEDEDQIAWFTAQHPEFTVEAMLRTRPDELGCDGFFVARMRRDQSPLASSSAL